MLNRRRAAEAVRTFADSIEAITRLVTPVSVRARGGYDASPGPHDLLLGKGQRVPLRGPARIRLQVRLRYRLVEGEDGWRGEIAAYQYGLLDADEHEIVAYHWHPDGQSHVVTPHLHLGAGAAVGRAELADAHLPTGPVLLAAVIRLAIEGFGVQPQRRQWQDVLGQTEAASQS
jgi:hypothetical protein